MSNVFALQVHQLRKVFEKKPVFPWQEKKKPYVAVDSISFELQEGEILGLLGPNGAGKTTTIQMLLSVLTPTSGTIRYFDKDLATYRSEILQDVAFASTYVNLPWRLTVYENLDVYGRLMSLPSRQRAKRIEKFLKFFGIWEQRDQDRSSLSAGQSTRLMLAKAFLAHPRVALLDEPTASLDPDIAQEVRAFVLEQRKEYQVSVLFTSHNMDEVTTVCDRVMFMKKGTIIANDTPAKLAKSLSKTTVHLLIAKGLKAAQLYATAQSIPFVTEKPWVLFTVDELHVAKLLSALATLGVEYTNIRIDAPTLEQYFLKTAKEEDTL